MKLVAYLRVSTIEQADKGYGLDVQREAVRKAAKSLGAKIVAWTVDEGKSGALDAANRPGLLDALTRIRDGKVNGLIVRDLDRLARAVSVQEAVLAEVWGSELCVVFTSVPPQEVPRDDPDDPMRTAMRQMRGMFHELDRRLIAKRLRDGRNAKAANGGHATGSPPYGWRVDKPSPANAHGALVPDPAEQAALARMRELQAVGYSTREIARVLAAEGHPTKRGGRWTSPVIARILARGGRGGHRRMRPLVMRTAEGHRYAVPSTPRRPAPALAPQPTSDTESGPEPTADRSKQAHGTGRWEQADLAYIYGVTQSTMISVVTGGTRRDVTDNR